MDRSYSIDEILVAVNDLQKNKSVETVETKIKKTNNSNIPINTLKLIEEAEKAKN